MDENDEDNASQNIDENPIPQAIVPRRATRRLVSQSTLREGDLDNAVLNSQQQFVDLPSDDSDSHSSSDRLFEEYLRQSDQQGSSSSQELSIFDTELPMHHSYLGNLDTMGGLNWYEPGKIYEIPVCGHHSMIFPGEILPMILLADTLFDVSQQSSEGLTFGLIFSGEIKTETVYGVTCQVYEKGFDANHDRITIKSRAIQRFRVIKDQDQLTKKRNSKFYAKVKILPEKVLPDPIESLNQSNNLQKFMNNSSQKNKIRKFLTSTGIWPKFVYDHYEVESVLNRINGYLALMNISAPKDPVQQTFWLARNILLTNKCRMKVFKSNCVNKRLLIIGQSMNFMCFFLCKRCRNKIASYNDIFAMSKGNLAGNYCNPAGYIHETLTVHKILESSLTMVQRPSTNFSWFPGYGWQIAICSKCSAHIGWKFIAVNKNLKPRTFFGLSGKSITVNANKRAQNDSDELLVDSDDGEDDDEEYAAMDDNSEMEAEA